MCNWVLVSEGVIKQNSLICFLFLHLVSLAFNKSQFPTALPKCPKTQGFVGLCLQAGTVRVPLWDRCGGAVRPFCVAARRSSFQLCARAVFSLQLYDFTAAAEMPCAVSFHPTQRILACGFDSGVVRTFSLTASDLLTEHK